MHVIRFMTDRFDVSLERPNDINPIPGLRRTRGTFYVLTCHHYRASALAGGIQPVLQPLKRKANGTPSALWMWGFVALAAAGSATAIISVHAATPLNHILRGVAGVLLLVGGVHQSRVVAYKRATRPLYSTFAPDSLILQRQVGWSAVILGAVLIASAVVAFSLPAT